MRRTKVSALKGRYKRRNKDHGTQSPEAEVKKNQAKKVHEERGLTRPPADPNG